MYLATRTGLTHTGLTLSPASVAPASFAHDLAAVEVAIQYELRAGGLVVSEREMRASGSREDYQLLDRVSRAVMWPDLVVETSTRCAVEVELTSKAKDRLRSKLLAYAGSTYATVIYRVDNRAVEVAVRAAGTAAGLGDRLRIEPIAPERPRAPHAGVDPPASELLSDILELQTNLAIAREEIDARGKEIQLRDARTRLIVNEVLAYLDAGPQQRGEIVRRWEREFASLRPHAVPGRGS